MAEKLARVASHDTLFNRLATVMAAGLCLGVLGAFVLVAAIAGHVVALESFALGMLIIAGISVAGPFLIVFIIAERDTRERWRKYKANRLYGKFGQERDREP